MMVTMMVFLAGIVSYMNLDMDLMPEIDIPIVVVSTTYVGAGPEEIENLVTKPLEESLSTVSNVENITSVSSANMSMVMVQFVDGTDIDIASMDLRDIIDRTKSTLPDDANEPNIIKMDMNAIPIYMGATAENMDLTALNEMLEDNVVNRLERIEGVASVDLTGGVEREVRITVDPDKLAGYGLTTSQLSQVLSAENMNLPSGSLSQGSTNVQVRTMGEFEDIEDIKTLPVTTPGGALIHLSDVAHVEETEVDRSSLSIIDGNYGIMISVNKQSTANLVEVSDKLNAEMEKNQCRLSRTEAGYADRYRRIHSAFHLQRNRNSAAQCHHRLLRAAGIPEEPCHIGYHCHVHSYIHHGVLCPHVPVGHEFERYFHGWFGHRYRYAGR